MSKKGMGREERECVKCGRKFSTHSQNRVRCEVCETKCREVHVFTAEEKKRLAERAEAKKKWEEAAAKLAAEEAAPQQGI